MSTASCAWEDALVTNCMSGLDDLYVACLSGDQDRTKERLKKTKRRGKICATEDYEGVDWKGFSLPLSVQVRRF